MSARTTAPSAAVRDVDVRGFVYSLEPVRQRQQWRLDKSMAELAQAQQVLAGTEAQMAQVLKAHDEQARTVGQALLERLDPAAHRRTLAYLAQLRGQWAQLDAQREEQRLARDRLRRACLEQQMRLEGLTRHKENALTEYADEVRQRASNEQDRDWLARSAFAQAAAAGAGE